ncbi:MAG: ATP-binding protein [Oligoflexia bacterium]|nr:ATP-binding protein [Oligoflexia bacterium]
MIEPRWAARALFAFVLLSVLGTAISALMSYLDGRLPQAFIELAFLLLSVVLLPFARNERYVRPVAHAAAAVSILHILASLAVTGATNPASAVFLTVLPTLFVPLLGKRAGVVWSLGGTLAALLLSVLLGLLAPIAPSAAPGLLWIALLVCGLQVAIAAFHATAHQKAISGLQDHARELSSRLDESRESEASREETRKQMLHTSKMASVGELATGVAHEINNPLQILRGQLTWFYDEFQRRAILNDELRTMLDRQATALNRIHSIVSGLTHYARPTGPTAEVFDANQAIEETLSLIEHLYRKRGITLDIRLQAPIPLIEGHVGQFSQIVMNLLSNARDALEGRPDGIIRIETENREDRFVLTVSDTGAGIAPEHLPRIFDAYFTTKGSNRGTGLGLSLTSSFVRQFNGRIDVKSEPGAGTAFRIDLPVIGCAATGAPAVPEAPPREYRFRKARILILDDERDVGDILRYILAEHGLDIDVFEKAGAALEALRSAPYDVVISDYHMPGMTGDQFIRQAREISGEKTHFLLITGNSRIIDRARETSEFAVLPKPFSEEGLLELLEDWLAAAPAGVAPR